MAKKPQNGAGLHNFIAQGGKPKDYEGTRGLNAETVNKLNKGDKKK